MKYSLLLIIFFGTLSGCASVDYHPVNLDKILASAPALTSQGSYAIITIRRDNIFWGSALDGRFNYDGEHIVTLSRGETFTFNAVPGQHKLGVKSIQPIMLIPISFYREIEVTLLEGHKYEYILKNIISAGLTILEYRE